MARPKKPNPLITSDQLLAIQNIPQLIRLKMNQKGMALERLSEQLGVSQSFLRGFLNQTNPLLQWRPDALERLINSPPLGWEPDEKTHLLTLHAQLPASLRCQPDTSITTKQLLATTRLNDFLVLKTKQLGIEKGTLSHLAGMSAPAMYEVRRESPRARQLMDEAIEGLSRGLKLSEEEDLHLKTLNALLPEAENHHSSFHYRRVLSQQANEEAMGWLDMTEYNKHPKNYALPTPDMLMALKHRDADAFNQARKQLRQSNDQLLYLRGFLSNEIYGLIDLIDFDLSNCDLTGARFSQFLRCDGVKLENSEILHNVPTEQKRRQYYSLPKQLRDEYLEQNPGFNLQSRLSPTTQIHSGRDAAHAGKVAFPSRQKSVS